jgi:glycosyltransferase involved in cell wall biosynthesis
LQRWSFRRAARVVTVTPGLRAMLVARFGIDPDRVSVVGNGTNLARLRPMDARTCRRTLGLPVDAPTVGFVGTFFHHQGVATLIAAAPAILAACPAARFLVVGDGPARDNWRDAVRAAGVREAFVFPGQVAHADVATWINAMDVCVAPFAGSRGETSPLKLFDYLACGRPVVVSAIAAVAEESRASGGCLDVPPDDPAALASAVRRLLADGALRQRLGDTGRAWVVRERGWDAVARRVLDVCTEALCAS